MRDAKLVIHFGDQELSDGELTEIREAITMTLDHMNHAYEDMEIK